MSALCCGPAHSHHSTIGPKVRRVLWIALVVNVVMFVVEVAGSVRSGSVSLLADSVDFAGDAANYGISLAVLSMGLRWRSRAAMVKGMSMAAYGLFVVGSTVWMGFVGRTPEPVMMGSIAALALFANVAVAVLLYAFRDGDANLRSVWLCSRNDAIGNLAVLLAAAGVSGTGSGWPDLIVALMMGGLALSSGMAVVRQARQELGIAQPLVA